MALTDGLISVWNMNNNWQDSVGTNHLTASGSVFSTDAKLGSHAGDFDGVDDFSYVASNATLNPTSAISISTWVKLDTSANYDSFVNKWWDGTDRNYSLYYTTIGSDSVYFNIATSDSNADHVAIKAITLDLGVYHHIVGTFDGQYVKVYVNNVLGGTVYNFGSVKTLRTNTVRLALGADGRTPPVDFMDGRQDATMIWNREITVAEISQLYNGGAGLELLALLAGKPYYYLIQS